MTNQQILEKAISKAIGGGWFDVANLCGFTVWTPVSILDTLIVLEDKDNHEKRQYNYQAVIFNHDFAKALWSGIYEWDEGNWDEVRTMTHHSKPAWQYHLQQMVIADDPIAYLGENL